MPSEGLNRKLTAILSADVKDYSRLMDQDEVLTIRTLTAHREVISSFVQQYKGRVVDTPGDNILAAFESVSDAVNCERVPYKDPAQAEQDMAALRKAGLK